MLSLLSRFFMLPRPAQSPAPSLPARAAKKIEKEIFASLPPLPKQAKPSKPAAAVPPPAPVVEPKKYYQQTNKKTPNVSAGRVIRPTHVVLHHTSGSYNGSVAWCMDPASKVSYHCIIARNGKRTVLALPTQRAWHAGVSEWQGRKDVNSFSIGLAWEGDTNETPLSEDAILSAVEYLLPILEEYRIPLSQIIRHADIAPGRKNDCSKQAQAALLAALNRAV
jgi:N-acetyl-anhydromuramyl-L-alanine amidase AmpD